jgi:hypothetical protein
MFYLDGVAVNHFRDFGALYLLIMLDVVFGPVVAGSMKMIKAGLLVVMTALIIKSARVGHSGRGKESKHADDGDSNCQSFHLP